jgi:catechol 2,3-dioxygenase
MAMNTWQSAGVGLRAPGLGLGTVEIEVPEVADVLAAADRLRVRGLEVDLETGADAARLGVDDPWGNRVQVSTPVAG